MTLKFFSKTTVVIQSSSKVKEDDLMNIKKALIIDASYQIHRSLAVEQVYEFMDSKGRRTGAIYQYLRIVMAALRQFPGYYPISCFDKGRSPRRLNIYPNYKHELDNRTQLENAKTNPELMAQLEQSMEYVDTYHSQREAIVEILRALGLPALIFEGWEGDDLQYITSRLVDESIIMTDDKDLIQLLAPNIRIWRPIREELIDYTTYQSEHHDPQMRKFVMVKAICGDGSDNIPGCAKGVGGKSAEFIADQMVTNPQGWQDVVANHKLKRIRSFFNEQYDKDGRRLPDPIDQFKLNMELVDLSKVVIDNTIQNQVVNELTNIKIPNFFKVASLLGSYEIKSIDVNELVRIVTAMTHDLESN